MGHKAAAKGQAAKQDKARSRTARRVLQQLFEVDPATIDESHTLADFEGCNLPNTAEMLTPTAWRTRVKDLVFMCFGVDCDLDEPISTLAARIELAERGICCTMTH